MCYQCHETKKEERQFAGHVPPESGMKRLVLTILCRDRGQVNHKAQPNDNTRARMRGSGLLMPSYP